MVQTITYGVLSIPIALCVALLIQVESNYRYNKFLLEAQRYCTQQKLTSEDCVGHAKTLYLLKNEN